MMHTQNTNKNFKSQRKAGLIIFIPFVGNYFFNISRKKIIWTKLIIIYCR